jgi:hypothetical protein
MIKLDEFINSDDTGDAIMSLSFGLDKKQGQVMVA